MKKVITPRDAAQLQEWARALNDAGIPFSYVEADGKEAIMLEEKDAAHIMGLANAITTPTPAPAPQKKKRFPRWARIALWVLAGWTLLAIILPKGSDEDAADAPAADEPATEVDSAALRQQQIQAFINPWDGSHVTVTRVIKESMNDPRSYEHVQTCIWDMKDHLVVKTKFRGTNGFGAVMQGSVYAKVDLQGNILEIKQE